MRLTACALALVLATLPAVAGEADSSAEIALPAHEKLQAPPRLAIGAKQRLLLALPRADGVDVVVSRGGPPNFSEPIAAVRRSDLMMGGRRGPRIAASSDESSTAVVLAAITKHTKEGGGDLLAWRSADGGATWGDAVRVSDVPGCAAEGLFDIAALGDGRFALLWLDIREKGTRLRVDFSKDGATWGEDAVAYESPGGSVCECCAPAITATSDGGAVVGFRNSIAGDRDVWTSHLARGAVKFDAAKKSGKGSWKLAACPMAAPAVDLAGDEVVCVWRRERNVYLVRGAAKERDLGEGTEPQIALAKDGVHAVWIAGDALVHLAPGAPRTETVAKAAAFPCAVGTEHGAWVAWLDTGTSRARLAALR